MEAKGKNGIGQDKEGRGETELACPLQIRPSLSTSKCSPTQKLSEPHRLEVVYGIYSHMTFLLFPIFGDATFWGEAGNVYPLNLCSNTM